MNITISHESIDNLLNINRNCFKHFNNKAWLIHDNGGINYIVLVEKYKIKVYKTNFNEEYNLIIELPFDNIFYSRDRTQSFHNNSLIIEKDKRYTYIGSEIYTFTLPNGEEIQQFYSDILNSGVPYPYIITQTYTVFLLNKEYISNKEIVENKDLNLYGFYYWKHEGIKNLLNFKLIHKIIF